MAHFERSSGELFVKEGGWYFTSNLYICGGRALINGAMNGAMLALY